MEELDERTLRALEIVLHPVTFERDDLVITKGAYDDMMFFVMSGKLLAHDIGIGDSRLVVRGVSLAVRLTNLLPYHSCRRSVPSSFLPHLFLSSEKPTSNWVRADISESSIY